MSSTKLRPVVGSVTGSIPALIRYWMLPLDSPSVKSHSSGPGSGRSGGSSSGGPHQTCTPWIWPPVMVTGSVRITRLVFGVMLTKPCPLATVSAIAVAMAARFGLRRRKPASGTKFFICRPWATTTGWSPRVSTSNQPCVTKKV